MYAASIAFYHKFCCLVVTTGCQGQHNVDLQSDKHFPWKASSVIRVPLPSVISKRVVTWRNIWQRFMSDRCASSNMWSWWKSSIKYLSFSQLRGINWASLTSSLIQFIIINSHIKVIQHGVRYRISIKGALRRWWLLPASICRKGSAIMMNSPTVRVASSPYCRLLIVN